MSDTKVNVVPNAEIASTDSPTVAEVIAELEAAVASSTSPANAANAADAATAADVADVAATDSVKPQETKGPAKLLELAKTDTVSEPPQKTELLSPQLSLLAKREKEIRKKRESLDAEIERRVEEQLSKFKEEIFKKAKEDPVKFFKDDVKAGNLHDYASAFWYHELGDAAPAEFKAKVQSQQAKAEIQSVKDLFNQFKAEQEQIAIQRERDVYVGQLRTQLDSLPDDMPYLREAYRDDPQEALETLCTIAGVLIQQTGKLPTPREVAAALEEQLDELTEKAYERRNTIKGKQNVTTPDTVAAPPTKPNTLSSAVTSGRANGSTDWDHSRAVTDLIAELEREQKAVRINK